MASLQQLVITTVAHNGLTVSLRIACIDKSGNVAWTFDSEANEKECRDMANIFLIAAQALKTWDVDHS